MDFKTYQAEASKSAKLDVTTDNGRLELVFGLSSETGSISSIYKKFLRDGLDVASQSEALLTELGDVLWYLSMISTSAEFCLDDIATRNIQRTHNFYGADGGDLASYKNDFDDGYLEDEKFPRRMIFRLLETKNGSRPHVEFSIEEASPNEFPDGQISDGGKGKGFTLHRPIGNAVNDNALDDDGYRYHDALHVSFMTILGWSPVMRELLRLKRKSKEDTDLVQDSARARDLEEAISAVLKANSEGRNNFKTPYDVDGDLRDIISKVTSTLEVQECRSGCGRTQSPKAIKLWRCCVRTVAGI